MPLRIAVIGAGHLGKIHARVALGHEDIRLVAIADPVREAAERVAEECRCLAVSDYRDLVGQIDAAIVAAPTCYHFDIGRELLRRGVSVLMEKPITQNTDEADQLVHLARLQQVCLQVGHIERFSPAFTAIRDSVAQPKLIQASRYTPYTFRSTDVSVVLDLMVHDIDLAMQLARSKVQSVNAMGMSVFGPHEDLAHARLVFDNGCVALLQASRVCDVPSRKMEVWTDSARYRADFADRTATIARTDARVLRGECDLAQLSGAEKEAMKPRVFEDLIHLEHCEPAAVNPIFEEQRDFLDAIREGRDPQVTGEHGRDVLAVAERIVNQIQSQTADRNHTNSDDSHILRGPHWQQHAPNRENRKSA